MSPVPQNFLSMRLSNTAILFFVTLGCIFGKSYGHGLMSWPRQRGLLSDNSYGLKVISEDANADFCPHCLNGGGPGSIKSHMPGGMWTPYEPTNPAFRFRDDHEICGDEKGVRDHMAPDGSYYAGVTIATYEEGDFVDMEAHVSAHHNGFFDFFSCDLDCCGEDDLSQKCFEKGCCDKMMRVPHTSCESGFDRICGPVDPKHPGRWYLPPRDEEKPEDNWYGGLNKKMRYALPKDMTCERCVIHWAWTTANSCNPPDYAEYNFPEKWNDIPGDGGSLGSINRSFGTCGDSGVGFPEEFWSCSENIRIVTKNGGKDRTNQIYHNGEMNMDGPDDISSSQLLPPMKEPVSVPVPEETEKETDDALSVETPTATDPREESLSVDSPTPSPEAVQTPTPPRESDVKSSMPTPAPEPETKEEPSAGSSYNLTLHVTSYDTGMCTAKDSYSYCQACLDLGYGVSKCFWCMKDASGKETCLHEKPM